MIKHQIETMLNIRGKDMPSVEEEFGSAGIFSKHVMKRCIGCNIISMTEFDIIDSSTYCVIL